MPETALLNPTSGFVEGDPVRGRVNEASSHSEDAQSQQLFKEVGQYVTIRKTLGWLGAYALVVSPRRCWLQEG